MKLSWRKIITMGMLAAVSYVLRLLEIPLPFLLPPFLKLDFSDLPALIGAFAFGPVSGIAISLVKNLLCLLNPTTLGIGELCNFLISVPLLLIAGLVYRKYKSRRSATLGALLGAIAAGLCSLPINYYIAYPLFARFLIPWDVILGMYRELVPGIANMWQALLIFNLPFTLIKGLLVFLLSFFIYKPLSPLLKQD